MLFSVFVADIHIREPEGDVLIFMTGQVSFYFCIFCSFIFLLGVHDQHGSTLFLLIEYIYLLYNGSIDRRSHILYRMT